MGTKYIDYMDSWRKPSSKYDDYAWQQDGGANDEGYHFKWCPYCKCETEHELSECLECFEYDKRIAKQQTWQEW
jgi:hypothetical protein